MLKRLADRSYLGWNCYRFLAISDNFWCCQIVHHIEDLKKSVEERASALKKSDEGAADLKRKFQELSTTLEECEREHQVVPVKKNLYLLPNYLSLSCMLIGSRSLDNQGVLAGKSNGDEEKCLEDQLRDAKISVGTAETELKQLNTKISHCEKELKEKKSQLMSKREEAVSVEKELDARKNDVESVKRALDSLPYEEGQMEALEKVSMLVL